MKRRVLCANTLKESRAFTSAIHGKIRTYFMLFMARSLSEGIGNVTQITFGHWCDPSRTDTPSTAVTAQSSCNSACLGYYQGI